MIFSNLQTTRASSQILKARSRKPDPVALTDQEDGQGCPGRTDWIRWYGRRGGGISIWMPITELFVLIGAGSVDRSPPIEVTIPLLEAGYDLPGPPSQLTWINLDLGPDFLVSETDGSWFSRSGSKSRPGNKVFRPTETPVRRVGSGLNQIRGRTNPIAPSASEYNWRVVPLEILLEGLDFIAL